MKVRGDSFLRKSGGGGRLKPFEQIIYQMDPLSSSDSIKWCAPTKELTFPTQLRTFVTLGLELGGKARRPILWNDSETKLRS